jgi:hypothetical protein
VIRRRFGQELSQLVKFIPFAFPFGESRKMIQPMNSSQVAALLAKTAKAAEPGQFELYKTSRRFDGTYANPQWLG